MFIVHVVRQFHPGVGGLENVVLELASAQALAGDRVRVVTLDRLFQGSKERKLPAEENLNGIEILRIPYFGSSRYPIAPSVLRHIKEADVVHVHGIDFFFDYLAWTRPIHGRKLVASTHGGFFHTTYAAWLKGLWFRTVTQFSMKSYLGVVAVSASDFERFRSIRPKGMVCIENGVNVSKFYDASAPSFQKSILWIGRFAKKQANRPPDCICRRAGPAGSWMEADDCGSTGRLERQRHPRAGRSSRLTQRHFDHCFAYGYDAQGRHARKFLHCELVGI